MTRTITSECKPRPQFARSALARFGKSARHHEKPFQVAENILFTRIHSRSVLLGLMLAGSAGVCLQAQSPWKAPPQATTAPVVAQNPTPPPTPQGPAPRAGVRGPAPRP